MSGLQWATYDIVEQLIARQGRVKHWADGLFSSINHAGVKLIDDGSSKKIQLDNELEFSNNPRDDTINNAFIYGALKRAQRIGYIGTRDISNISIKLAKYGSPSTSGNLIIELREGGIDGEPTGTLLGSTSIPLTSISTTPTFFDFSVNFSITASTSEKFIVIYLSSSIGDGSNYYFATGIGIAYSYGEGWYYNGSDWSVNSKMGFILTTTKVTEGYVTQGITDTSLGQFLNLYHTVVNNGGSVVVSITDSSGNIIAEDVTNGGDLTGITNPERHTTFALRANLSRPTASSDTPELKWWGISYIGDTT